MAEALWALGSASALRAWVGLSRPKDSSDGVNKGIKILILKESEGWGGSTGQQAGTPDQQLEVELVRRQVGCWAGENRVGALLLQGPVLFPRGGAEAAGGSEENDTERSALGLPSTPSPPSPRVAWLDLGRTRSPQTCRRFRSCWRSPGP